MIYVYHDIETNTFSSFTDVSHLNKEQLKNVVSADNPPNGNGDLKFDENRNIYLEAIATVAVKDIEEKEYAATPAPTIEDRLEAIEQTSAYTQIQVEYLATLAEINNGL